MVMINEDEGNAETIIRAYRGNDTVKIQKVSVNEDSDKAAVVNVLSDDGGYTWKVSVSNITSTSNIVSIKLDIQLVEGVIRHKTFKIYQTKFDVETVSLDFGDDKILVPCANGTTPDAGFLEALKIPVLFRVNGKSAVPTLTTEIDFDTYFAFDGTNLTVKQFPGSNQTETVKFTASVGDKSDIEYITFTKFDTKGGTIAMYSLQVHANDIVCDTTGSENVYTVYTGQVGHPNNVIKATVSKYSSDGNQQILLSELPSNYRVYYANDPQDKYESVGSVFGEYLQMDDDGVEIGKTISPDNCVSFQLREWIGTGEAWGDDMSEGDYKVWDQENIVVDIIRDIASYKFVLTPDKVTLKHDGNLSADTLTLGVSKNKAGDGNPNYEVLKNIPAGYDIYYSLDGEENWIKVGGESENPALPATIDISAVKEHKKHIVFQMVLDEESSEDNLVVLSETVEIASEIPGKNAYSGYLTDSMGVVSCDANGEPTVGQELSTEFKITNAKSVKIVGIFTDKDCTIPVQNGVFSYNITDGIVTFSNFTSTLPETLHLYLKASYTDAEGVEALEGDILGYTIAKLKVAEASTVLTFSNSNVVVPCDENGETKVTEVVTYVAMMYGDEELNLTMESKEGITFKESVENGYHKLTIDVSKITFNGDVGYCTMKFTGTGDSGTYTRTGQVILSKVKAGESGHVWDLVLSTNSPKFNNDTDKFDDDYVEGWINVWSANDAWEIASYEALKNAGRYIVHRANDVTDAIYSPLNEVDFTEGKFKIYINPDKPEGRAFEDLDSNAGIEIALAEFKNGIYIPIQSEIVRASYDGRDFSKFELVLSVENITRTYQDLELQTTSPNKIDIVGIYEHEGPKKLGITNVNNIHNQHVSGLDVYYGVDLDLTAVDISNISEAYLDTLEPLIDVGNDGMIANDSINIENLTPEAEYLNVLLIAHYDDPDVEGNITKLQLVDHKAIKIVRVDLPDTLLNYRISLDQDSIIVPVDGAYVVDPDFTATVSPKLYSNDDLITGDSTEFKYAISSDFNAPVDDGVWKEFTNSVSLSSEIFVEKPSYVWFKYEYDLDNDKKTSVSKACQILYSKNPVEIIVDKKTVKRDIYTGLINDTVSLEVRKWDYNENVWANETGYTVKLECNTDADDNNEILEVITASNNKYTVNFGVEKYKNVRYIKFSVYNSDGGLLGFENVSVLTDGIDGDSQEFLYYRCNVDYTNGGLPAPDKISGVNTENYQNAE